MAAKTDQKNETKEKSKWTSKRIAWIIFFSAVAAAIFIAIALPGRNTSITLPTGSAAPLQGVVTEQTNYQLSDANITKQNVQQVIASLARPKAYSVSISNTLYWDGEWQEIQAAQWVQDDICLTQYNDSTGVAERFEAVAGEQYYAWRRGSATYYTAPTGVISADDTGMIPTYETVVSADTDSITEAGLRTVNGESCIYVAVADADTGYHLTYWVSTVSGLLVQADYTRGSELVRSVVVSDIKREELDQALFNLPDGSSLLDVTAVK